MNDTTDKQIRKTRRSPGYWRVTFDHPRLNIFGPETIPQLNELLTSLARPAAQMRIGALFQRGFHEPGDVETRHVGGLGFVDESGHNGDHG